MSVHTIQFAPNLHQRHTLEAVRLFPVVWMCGGYGSGKTWTLVQYAREMVQRLAPGIDGLIVEPDYDTFRDVFMVLWREIYPGEGKYWELRSSQKDGRHLWVKGVNGNPDTKIYYRSAHNEQYVRKIDSLTTIGWAGLDEPSRMQCGQRAFELTQARCRSRKILNMGWKHNPILIVGVPDGFNWLASNVFGCREDHPAHAYKIGYRPDPANRPGYYIRACKTGDNIDNLDPSYEKNARQIWNETYANQMFAAALVSSQGMILPEWSRALHVIPNDLADKLWETRVIRPIGGMDWGFTAPGATEIMGWTGDHELIVIDEWYERGKQVQEQGYWAWQAAQRWGRHTISQGGESIKTMPFFGDPANPGHIELLQKGFDYVPGDGIPRHLAIDCHAAKYHGSSDQHTSTQQGWQARIDHLRGLLSPRLNVQHPNFTPDSNPGCPRLLIAERCKNLIEEIPAYRQKLQQEGKPTREGATGSDHAIDCVTGGAYTTDVLIQPRGATSPTKRGGQLVGRRLAQLQRKRGHAF